jgi:hypothetical protein
VIKIIIIAINPRKYIMTIGIAPNKLIWAKNISLACIVIENSSKT